MQLNIIKSYLKNNRCYQQNKKRDPIGIQIHSIGCGQGTAQSVADYWNQSSVSCCTTYLVDADVLGKVLQLLPEDVYTWSDAGFGNRSLITIETCESDYVRYTSGAEFTVLDDKKVKEDLTRAYKNTVALCVDICKRFKWNPKDKLSNGLYLISSHYEGNKKGVSSNHVDPEHIWERYGLTMDKLRNEVYDLLNGSSEELKPVETKVENDKAAWYRIRKSWEDVSSQLGAYLVLKNARDNCPVGYSVFDVDGKIVYTNDSISSGTIAADFNGLSETVAAERILDICRNIAIANCLFPSIAAAQTILESGYCTTELAKKANNVCGMKCSLSGNTWSNSTWDGKSKVTIKTKEQDAKGKEYTISADFRKYNSIEESIADRCAYLLGAKNGNDIRYKNIQAAKDYKEQIQIIKNGGYATDVSYVDKIINIVERYNLSRYDDEVNQKSTVVLSEPLTVPSDTDDREPKKQYIVQCGVFENEKNAVNLMKKLTKSGFKSILKINIID